jgi:MYXO-CTERM domain-containing protein
MSCRGALGFTIMLALVDTARAQDVSDLTSPPPTDPIIGGEETGEEFAAVVAILAHQGLCTGTIVSDKIVLTAGHCLAQLEFDQDVTVFWGPEIDMNRRVSVARWGVHPKFCADCKEDIYDYGFVEIEGAFTGATDQLRPVATQAEWDAAMRKGGEVLLVGYGEDPEEPGIDKGLGTKRVVTTTISRFSKEGLEFFAGGDDRDSCQGDSGGPAFVRLPDGSLRLAGITSRGSNPCGDGGFYGAPYPALCWLETETGLNLRADGCAACDCIDMSPPDDDSGCRIAAPPDPDTPSPGWLALLLLAHRRRRRRPR